MSDDYPPEFVAALDQRIEHVIDDVLRLAACYDGMDVQDAGGHLTMELEQKPHLALAAALATLAIRMHRTGGKPGDPRG